MQGDSASSSSNVENHEPMKDVDTSSPLNSNPDDPVPQLAAGDISFAELATAVKVLSAVAALKTPSKKRKVSSTNENGLEAYKHKNLRPLRKVLVQCLDIQRQLMFDGKDEQEYMELKLRSSSLKRQKCAERALQKKYVASTALRKGRTEKLKEKQSEAHDEEVAKLQQMMMIPDGHVDTSSTSATTTQLLTNAPETVDENEVKLPKMRSCYVCKVRFRELHHFYDQLCPTCAALNWEKRHQTANLSNKVAVVTGSRVKIGYQTCLKLLRAGATVVATTRFPNSAAATYRKEPDFLQWCDRLQVYGLDLRDVTGIEAFCRFLKMRFAECGLDILINNACQTVRRPTAYYLPACRQEEELWKEGDETHRNLLHGCMAFERVRRKLLLDHQQMGTTPGLPQAETQQAARSMIAIQNLDDDSEAKPNTIVSTVPDKGSSEGDDSIPFETTGMSHSAAMSQMVLLPEDAGVSDEILPPGVTDINGQQLDLSKTNSWLLKMEEVSTPEVMECMFINALAPFVLNSRLKPLMNVPNPHEDRYIVNVSAMEGKFYRYKMANHPHTNMAKAALNMMTRTSAEDLAKTYGIYMNSIDTGWINDENPLERATKTAKTNLFQTPIDEIDAAARILDPVFSGVNHPNEKKAYGMFLKDYHETEW